MTRGDRSSSKQRLAWLAFSVTALVTATFFWTRASKPPRTGDRRELVSTAMTEVHRELAPSAASARFARLPPAIRQSNATAEPAIDFATASFEELERRLSREPENAEWAENASDFVGAALDSVDAGMNTKFAVRCGNTVCRAAFEGQDLGTLVELASTSRSAGISSRYKRLASDGGYKVVVYFGRTPSDTPTTAP